MSPDDPEEKAETEFTEDEPTHASRPPVSPADLPPGDLPPPGDDHVFDASDAGNPLSEGFSSRSTRRSTMTPSPAMATARQSRVSATG